MLNFFKQTLNQRLSIVFFHVWILLPLEVFSGMEKTVYSSYAEVQSCPILDYY